MAYPVSVNYVEKVEAARHFLFCLAFTEYHPEPLQYEEVQHHHGILLSSVWIERVRDEYLGQKSNIVHFKGIFSDILEHSHVRNGTAKRWHESEESLLYNKSAIVKRLKNEGNTAQYIAFYLSQVYQLQQTILERMDAVRILFEWIEHPEKYKRVEWLGMFSPFFESNKRGAGRKKASAVIVQKEISEADIAGDEILHTSNGVARKAWLDFAKKKNAIFESVTPKVFRRALMCGDVKTIATGTNLPLLVGLFKEFAKFCTTDKGELGEYKKTVMDNIGWNDTKYQKAGIGQENKKRLFAK